MKRIRIIAGAILLILILTACQPAQTATPEDGYPAPAPTQAAEDYPYPAANNNNMDLSFGYPVLAGDEDMMQGNFFIDSAELQANPSDSTLTDLYVKGSLPTPCNIIRAYVNPPDANNNIFVQVYSVVEKDKICTQVIQPYEGVATTFKDIPAGTYSVYANNLMVGQVTIP